MIEEVDCDNCANKDKLCDQCDPGMGNSLFEMSDPCTCGICQNQRDDILLKLLHKAFQDALKLKGSEQKWISIKRDIKILLD